MGRPSVFVNLHPLNLNLLKHILTKLKNEVVKQFREIMRINNAVLHATEKASDIIAQQARNAQNGDPYRCQFGLQRGTLVDFESMGQPWM